MPKNITIYSPDRLIFDGMEFRCAIGKNGITDNKKEGDGATPAGCFPVREIFYRSDRLGDFKSIFPKKELSRDDGWCDDPKDEKYNQFVELPYGASAENLWRDDELYDIVVVLGYNDEQIIPGNGSAIFMHIARPDYSPTDGCIALSRKDLLTILSSIEKDASVCVIV